jgi:hypothetical protein
MAKPMDLRRLLPLLAGVGAVAIAVVYLLIMKRQDDLAPDAVSVLLVAATFISSAVAFLMAVTLPSSPRRIILLTWGSTVALFWTVLLNTLTPLWLPIAIFGWIGTVQAARRFRREDGDNPWPLVGGTAAIAVVVLGLIVFGSVVVDRSPSSGSTEGTAQPR